MLDFSYINKNDIQVFTNPGTWQTWRKPRGAKMIQIFCLGGGGGGCGGSTTIPGTPCAGSAGGGASSYTTGIFPAFALPDILYVQVGIGGAGSLGLAPNPAANTQNTKASNGTTSSISLTPSISASSIILASGNTAGGGGSGATGGTAGTGGTVGPAGAKWTSINSAISSLGIIMSYDGVPGTNGAISANALNIQSLSPILLTGGVGGGGRAGNNTCYNGGSILPSDIYLLSTVAGGAGIITDNGGNGENGYGILFPIFCGTGGGGGGTSGILTGGGRGGRGGNGFYGCGGGAGGSAPSTTPVSPTGAGGKGGDGLVIITTIF